MGSDIYSVFQRHDVGTGLWVDIPSRYDERRDTALFSVLRSIAEPRGVPAGFVLDFGPHDLGDHSESWLTGTELLAAQRGDLAYFFDEVGRLSAEYGDIRFVFGFD